MNLFSFKGKKTKDSDNLVNILGDHSDMKKNQYFGLNLNFIMYSSHIEIFIFKGCFNHSATGLGRYHHNP